MSLLPSSSSEASNSSSYGQTSIVMLSQILKDEPTVALEVDNSYQASQKSEDVSSLKQLYALPLSQRHVESDGFDL